MRQPIDPALLSPAEITARYGLSAFTLSRWVRLGRVRPRYVPLARGEIGSPVRYLAGDIVAAIEHSRFDEPGSRH